MVAHTYNPNVEQTNATRSPVSENNVGINREIHCPVFISAAVINTDQKWLREEQSYLAYTSGSHFITDRSQGRNLKQKPWRSTVCWLPQGSCSASLLVQPRIICREKSLHSACRSGWPGTHMKSRLTSNAWKSTCLCSQVMGLKVYTFEFFV